MFRFNPLRFNFKLLISVIIFFIVMAFLSSCQYRSKFGFGRPISDDVELGMSPYDLTVTFANGPRDEELDRKAREHLKDNLFKELEKYDPVITEEYNF